MEKTIESILPVILVFVISGLYFSWDILVQREERNKIFKTIVCILVLFYFAYIFLQITLHGRECAFPRKMWIIPLYSYYKYLSGWQVYLFKQNIQNILLFMPLGFFLNALLGRKTKRIYRNIAIGVGFLLSFLVEITQYVKAIGLFEVDDLLHNTFGTFLGCLVYDMICCLRIQRDKSGRWKIVFENKDRFLKNANIVAFIFGIYLIVILIAFVNHLYHVYVLWR